MDTMTATAFGFLAGALVGGLTVMWMTALGMLDSLTASLTGHTIHRGKPNV